MRKLLAISALVLLLSGVVFAQASGTNYRKQGGTESVIGGTATIESSAIIAIDADASVAIGSQSLTSAPLIVTAAISAEFANTITVSVDFKDAGDDNVASVAAVLGWISDNADCEDEVSSAPTTGPAIAGSVGTYINLGGSNEGQGIYIGDATGNVNFTIAHVGSKTIFWCALEPLGTTVSSGAITFQ